jgi:hypothetical protein
MSDTTSTTALSPRELWEQQQTEANAQLDALAETVTQRDWLIITRTLDRTRQQVKEKRDHGGASWDRLLDLTDRQLERLHGFPDGDGSDLSTDRPAAPAPAGDDGSADSGPVPGDG